MKPNTPMIYGRTPTFLGVPQAHTKEDLRGADVAIVGVPVQFVSAGPGAAPSMLNPLRMRQESINYSGFIPELEIDILEKLKIVDYGDIVCPLPILSDEITSAYCKNVEKKISDVLQAECTLVTLSGLNYSIVKTITDNLRGKLGIIQFDAHDDAKIEEETPHGSGWLRQVVDELEKVDGKNYVHIGLRGPIVSKANYTFLKEKGLRLYTIREIRDIGWNEVVKEAIHYANDGTEGVWINVDYDVLDMCPGYDIPMGITAHELFSALHEIGKSGFIGLHSGGMISVQNTSLYRLANWTIIYALSGLAAKGKNFSHS